MITRHDLYLEFRNTWKNVLPESIIIRLFNSTSDEELCKNTGLKILRKGYFVV